MNARTIAVASLIGVASLLGTGTALADESAPCSCVADQPPSQRYRLIIPDIRVDIPETKAVVGVPLPRTGEFSVLWPLGVGVALVSMGGMVSWATKERAS